MEKSDLIKVRGRNFVCQLCDIKITSEKAVEDHLAGKKHQKHLSLQNSRQQEVQRSIFVGGLSRLVGEAELGDYFSKYGDVAKIIIDKEKAHYAIIEFSSEDSAQQATKEERHLMNGRKIVVRPRQPKTAPSPGKGHVTPKGKHAGRDRSGKKSQPQSELDEALHQKLQQEHSVSGQMSALVQLLELTSADQNLRHLICNLLQSALEEFLPGCCITPFGSSVNGFGVQGCDLDIHLELGEPVPGVSETQGDPQTLQIDSKKQLGCSDEGNMLDVASATPLEVLSLVMDVIKRCVPGCCNVHLIPSARLPVVKFTHKESGLMCDISMNNRLALQNTKLLKFYSSLESQVRPLVFTIRRWAKHHQLAGNIGGAGPLLTNYALTLMVIFYLQARDRPLLPNVAELKPSGDGWDNSSFIHKLTSSVDSPETHGTLLAGFFSFYNHFDFATTVVCPLHGKTISLSDALHSAEGCHESERSFKTGAINIQDPFELWHNVALNVNEKTAEKLVEEFGIAESLCQSRMTPEAGDSWGLLALFDSSSQSPSRTQSVSNPPSVSGTGSAISETRLEIHLKSSHLSERFIMEHPDPADLKSAWCDAMKQLVYHLLTETLRLECHWSCRQELPCQDASKEVITPGLPEKRHEEPECDGRTSSVGGESSAEGSSEVDKSEPPPSKRCRVEEAKEDVHNPALHCTGTVSQGGSTSLPAGMTPWHKETEILECTAYHPVWLGRRKARRQLLLQSRHNQQEASDDIVPPAVTAQSCTGQDSETLPTRSEASTEENKPDSQTCGIPLTEDHQRCEAKTSVATTSSDASVSGNICQSTRISKSHLASQWSSDSFLQESKITNLIISDQLKRSQSVASILKFTLRLTDKTTEGDACIVMHFLPGSGEVDFKVFLHFFDIYVRKMLDQYKI